MRTLWQDVRFGIRVLARTPGQPARAITLLACRIGGTPNAFALAHALFWKPLPGPNAASLVQVHQPLAGRADQGPFQVSCADYLHFRDHTRSLAALAAHY